MGERFSYTMKDLPEDERPREKMYKYGTKALSNSELLAIIIRTGNRKNTALEICHKLLSIDKKGLGFLAEASVEELTRIDGVGKCKAAQILAAIEIGKRISTLRPNNNIRISSPLDISNLVMEEMRYFKKEYFRIVMLDTKNQIITIEDISVGNLNSSIVHPREVFRGAIKRSSASIILIHNHPSGDPTPSKEDIGITNRLVESGNIIGIAVLDHIIIGDSRFYSFKENNLI